MPNQVIVSPYSTKRTGLPTVSMSDVTIFESNYETLAYEHWRLNGVSSSLTGLKSSRLLTQVGTVTAGDGYFTTGVGANIANGLVSDKSDALIQTQCAVVRLASLPTSSSQVPIILGSLVKATSGSALYFNYSNKSLQRQFYPAIGNVTEQLYADLANAWIFVAFSENGDGTQTVSTLYVGGTTVYSAELTHSIVKTLSSSNVGVGQVGYLATGATTINLDIAEYIIFDQYLSANQIAAVYARSKRRMSADGITVI